MDTEPARESPYISALDIDRVTFNDAAAAIGISIPLMKSRVQRGRAKLRELFEECCRLELDVRPQVVVCECRSEEAAKCSCGSSEEPS